MIKRTFLKIFVSVMTLAFLPAPSMAQKTLGSGSCGIGQTNCHAQEGKWWDADKHKGTADPFLSSAAKYREVAQRYGIRLNDFAKVNQSCMKCHGTVVSASATKEAEEGVSCESCHGGGSGYLETHDDVKGQGYANGVPRGLTANKDLNVRAKMCVDCHYITEQKLIDAGHPIGDNDAGFYVSGLEKKIAKHWRTFRSEGAGKLQPAFTKAITTRGPAPIARTPAPGTTPSSGGGTTASGTMTPTPTTPTPVTKTRTRKETRTITQPVREPPSPYATLGPTGCGLGQNNCHAEENGWWERDDHYVTIDPFLSRNKKYEDYLKRYGILGNTAEINKSCMTCHGTVISAEAASEVETGVSCESCHGPGSAYRDPHTEGDVKDGLNRSGYRRGLELGMRENKNLEVRGRTCVRCHAITDQILIQKTGHPTGDGFDYIRGMKKVGAAPHWKHAVESKELLEPAFTKALTGNVLTQIVEIEEPDPDAVVVEQVGVAPEPPPVIPPPAPVSRSIVTPPLEPLELPPLESVSDTTSLQNLLLIVKRRLELLYQKTGGAYQP